MMEQMKFVTLPEVLGDERFADLLFKCRRDLENKVTDVKKIQKDCESCGRPQVVAWEFTQNGVVNQYSLSDVCSSCLKGIDSKRFADEIKKSRQKAFDNKWYHIDDENDPCGLKNYEASNSVTSKALEKAKDYTRKIIFGNLTENLLLFGNPGTGKTHLAKSIAKTAKHKGYAVAFINAETLFNNLKSTFGNVRHNSMLYSEFTDFDLVVIDDVGLETKKLKEVSWSVSEWTRLVDSRLGKATIYTTNLNDNTLAEVVGERAKSRMYVNSTFIDLFTDDYRKSQRIG